MCDTWVALRNATRDRQVIFAKNSDRPIFDCQPLLFEPGRAWPAGSRLELEYVGLPQAERTYAHLGSSPYWCWGYEEGINEHSVVIGNEALFTRPLRQLAQAQRGGQAQELGLLGMDIVRLALERSRTAAEAVDLAGRLVEGFGVFGSGVPGKGHAEGAYDNAFLIADPREAWIVETVGRRWAARCVRQGVASISNQPSIRSAWDRGSADLAAHAIAQGWWPADAPADFDFARAYVDEQVARQVSHLRMMRSRQLLGERQGEVTVPWMMRIARDHYEDTFLAGPYFDAADPDVLSLCMHVSPAGFTWGNTATSCVAVLPDDADGLPVFWWTPGPPCTGCYVPFFVHGSRLPPSVSQAGAHGKRMVRPDLAQQDTFAPTSYWWLFRRLLDTVKGGAVESRPGFYHARQPVVRARFDALEAEFAAEVPAVMEQAAAERATDPAAAAERLDEFTARCVQRVCAELDDLLCEFSSPTQALDVIPSNTGR